MKYIATEEALEKLNKYKVTEHEVMQEINARRKVYEEHNLDDLVLNWKGKEIVALPIGKTTAILFIFGQEMKGSYEDLPQIVYKKNKWNFKGAK